MEMQRTRRDKQKNRRTKARNCDFIVDRQKRYSGEYYGKQFEDEICMDHPYHNHVLKLRDGDEINHSIDNNVNGNGDERIALEEIARDYNDIADIGDEFQIDTTTDSGFISTDVTIEGRVEVDAVTAIDAEFGAVNDARVEDTYIGNKQESDTIKSEPTIEDDITNITKQVSMDSLKDAVENIAHEISDTKDSKEYFVSSPDNREENWNNEIIQNLYIIDNLNERDERCIPREQSASGVTCSVVNKTESVPSVTDYTGENKVSLPVDAVSMTSSIESLSSSVKSREHSAHSVQGSYKSATRSSRSLSSKTGSASSKVGSIFGSVKSVFSACMVGTRDEKEDDTEDFYRQSRHSWSYARSYSLDSSKSRLRHEVEAHERRNKLKRGYSKQADYMEKCFDITNDRVGPYHGSVQQYKNCLRLCTKLDLEVQRLKALSEESIYKHFSYIDEERNEPL